MVQRVSGTCRSWALLLGSAGVPLRASPSLKRSSAGSRAQPCGALWEGLGLTWHWGTRNTAWSHQVELVEVKPLPLLSCSLASAQNQPVNRGSRLPNLACPSPSLRSALHPASSACAVGVLAQDGAQMLLLRAMIQPSFK